MQFVFSMLAFYKCGCLCYGTVYVKYGLGAGKWYWETVVALQNGCRSLIR